MTLLNPSSRALAWTALLVAIAATIACAAQLIARVAS